MGSHSAIAAAIVACLAWGLIGLRPVAAAASPAWLLPASPLSAPGQSAEAPQVAVDPAGDALAVWSRSNGTNTIVEAASRQAGGAWSSSLALSASAQNAHSPQVAIDAAGEALAVWTRYDGSNTIVEGSSAQIGGAWRGPTQLSAPGQSAEAPQVAVDPAGDVLAVWSRSNGTNTIVEAASRQAGGAWSSSLALSASAQNAHSPQVAIDAAGEALAVWTRYDGSNTIVEGSSAQIGGAWRGPTQLSAPGQSAEAPQVAVDPAGDALAVWSRSNGTNTIVEAASRQAGGAWSSSLALSASAQNAYSPQVAIDAAGEALAVWTRYDGSNTIVEGSSAQIGGAWRGPTQLSAPGQSAEAPQVAVDPAGDALAVWSRSNGTNTIVEAASRQAGGAWAAPVALSSLGRSASALAIGADSWGDALASWQQLDGAHAVIEAAAADAAGPQLRSLVIPTVGTVHQPVSFSVSPFDVWTPIAGTTWNFGDGASVPGTSARHGYARPGVYEASVTSVDAIGNATRQQEAITIFAKASAKRIVSVKGRRATVRLHCPSTGFCRGNVRLIAGVVLRRHSRPIHRRESIGRSSFQIPGKRTSRAVLRLTRAGLRSLHGAGRPGLKAQLTGPGVKHRAVLLIELEGGGTPRP